MIWATNLCSNWTADPLLGSGLLRNTRLQTRVGLYDEDSLRIRRGWLLKNSPYFYASPRQIRNWGSMIWAPFKLNYDCWSVVGLQRNMRIWMYWWIPKLKVIYLSLIHIDNRLWYGCPFCSHYPRCCGLLGCGVVLIYGVVVYLVWLLIGDLKLINVD